MGRFWNDIPNNALEDALQAEADYLDPEWRGRGWQPLGGVSGEDFNPDRRRAFVSFAATWADVVAPVRVFRYNLRRPGAVAQRYIKARGQLRYLALKVALKLVDLGIQVVNHLLGRDLIFSLRLLGDEEGFYSVRLFPKRGQETVCLAKHPQSSAASESRDPSTAEGTAE